MIKEKTIPQVFEKQVAANPDIIAVVDKGEFITYAELNRKINQTAHYLRDLGVESGTPVALCMTRSLELLVAIMGVLKAGGAYVPLDPGQPESRLISLMKNSDCLILITQESLQKKWTQFSGEIVTLNWKKLNNYSGKNPKFDIVPNNLAYIIYTSGSTGIPKGVLIEHQSVVNHAAWFSKYCGCKVRQRIDFSGNYIFDMAVTASTIALTLGLSIVICSEKIKENIRSYLSYLNEEQIQIIKITPCYFKALLHEIKNNSIPLPYLEIIILGGEPLPTADCITWLTAYPKHKLFNEYGPTEATIAVTHYPITKDKLNRIGPIVPIGKPGKKMYCYVLDEKKQQVKSGDVGELFIGGNCLARGYLKQDKITRQKFIPNPYKEKKHAPFLYKTGDLARVLSDGNIEYIGRTDFQIKIRGFRIEPGEIEHCLLTYPTVKDVVVLAQNTSRQDKQLVAYYILKENKTNPKVGDLQQHISASLPSYMMPHTFVRVDSFPLTPNGKLDRQSLPVPQFFTQQHYRAPKTHLEKRLSLIWSEELGVKPVGVKDNFFELGGDSLIAARIISSITRHFRKEVSLAEFYKAMTIHGLIKTIKKKRKRKPIEKHLPKLAEKNLLPLSEFQLLMWLSATFEPSAQQVNIVGRRRLQGDLDREALEYAFAALFKKHEMLFFQILTYRPAQMLCKDLRFKIYDHDLTNSKASQIKDYEKNLKESFAKLLYFYPWPKQEALIRIHLFHLPDNMHEIQICLSHFIADSMSIDLIFADLSYYYLAYQRERTALEIVPNKHYRHYIDSEQLYFDRHLERDYQFWRDYLHNTHMFAFPKKSVINNPSPQFDYSTYKSLTDQKLRNLQQLCATHGLSIHEGLTAVIILSLQKLDLVENNKKYIFVNIVKSTRDKPSYDHSLGCFLRVDSLKIFLDKQNDLINTAQQVHDAIIVTAPHQHTASILKIAQVSTFKPKGKMFLRALIKILIIFYCQLFYSLKLKSKILLAAAHLAFYKRSNYFIININEQPNFFNNQIKSPESLFGLLLKKPKIFAFDLLKARNVFDINFLRTEDNKPYIAISANLTSKLREHIAQTIIEIISRV